MESVLKFIEGGPDEDLLSALRHFNEQVRRIDSIEGRKLDPAS